MVSVPTPVSRQAPTENAALVTTRTKRSPELENGNEAPASKKARTANGETNAPEAHSTSIIFRKFVNNALNEKAAVGPLYHLAANPIVNDE